MKISKVRVFWVGVLWFATAYICLLIVPYMDPVGRVVHAILIVPIALFVVWALGFAGAGL